MNEWVQVTVPLTLAAGLVNATDPQGLSTADASPDGKRTLRACTLPPQETNPRDAFPAIRVKRRWTGINPLDPSGLTLPKTPLQPFAGETPDATVGGVSWWRENSPSGHVTLGADWNGIHSSTPGRFTITSATSPVS